MIFLRTLTPGQAALLDSLDGFGERAEFIASTLQGLVLKQIVVETTAAQRERLRLATPLQWIDSGRRQIAAGVDDLKRSVEQPVSRQVRVKRP